MLFVAAVVVFAVAAVLQRSLTAAGLAVFALAHVVTL